MLRSPPPRRGVEKFFDPDLRDRKRKLSLASCDSAVGLRAAAKRHWPQPPSKRARCGAVAPAAQAVAATLPVLARKFAYAPTQLRAATDFFAAAEPRAAAGLAKVRYLSIPGLAGDWRRGPMVARGGFSKIYDLLAPDGSHFKLRLLHLDPPRTNNRALPAVCVSTLSGIEAEYEAMRAVASPLLPLATFSLSRDDGLAHISKVGWVQPAFDADFSVLAAAATGSIPAAVARQLACALLEQLAAIHAAGYVHRDIKPENVLYRRGGSVVLADFGHAAKLPLGDHALSAGTHGYLAPEGYGLATVPGALDARLDLYSLGATLSAILLPEQWDKFPMAMRDLAGAELGSPDFFYSEGLRRSNHAWGFELLRQGRMLGCNEADVYLHYADAWARTEALRQAWLQLDPALGALFFDGMMAIDRAQRPSAAQALAQLRGAPSPVPAHGAAALAHYFDEALCQRPPSLPAWLAADPSAATLSLSMLRAVPLPDSAARAQALQRTPPGR